MINGLDLIEEQQTDCWMYNKVKLDDAHKFDGKVVALRATFINRYDPFNYQILPRLLYRRVRLRKTISIFCSTVLS